MKEILAAMMAATFEQYGELKLIEALQLLYGKDPIKYEVAVRGGHAFCTALKPLTDKSKTPIDDAILNSIKEALETSAAANGITL